MSPSAQTESKGEGAGLGLTPLEDVRSVAAKTRAAEDDEFESEWRDGQDDVEPLTDAVRAARLRRAQQMSQEGDEFAAAFEEEAKA